MTPRLRKLLQSWTHSIVSKTNQPENPTNLKTLIHAIPRQPPRRPNPIPDPSFPKNALNMHVHRRPHPHRRCVIPFPPGQGFVRQVQVQLPLRGPTPNPDLTLNGDPPE